MVGTLHSECYRQKAAEMLRQASRAENAHLRAMYASIAVEWDLQADAIEGVTSAFMAGDPQKH
jgi:hypothetical protein